MIVSELVNRYVQLKHKLVSSRVGLREFRRSRDFVPVAQEIAANVARILSHCMRVGSDFDTMNVAGLVDEYAKDASDFND